MKKSYIFVGFLCILTPLFSQNNGSTSIAMLNYLATESRVINGSKNNRLILEELYTKLINNTNPSIVDQTTQDYLQTMLDIIEGFRIITLQRERLEYIFENQQAQAITQALPNPLYLLGARDLNPLSLIATATAMTIDSVFKFQNATNSAEMDFLKGNWELDDKESAELHTLRSKAFGYMVDTARNNNLSMTDTLNERSIDNFVSYTFDENLQRRRQSLENNRALYAKYAPYWIVLAETYYDLGLYRECIDAVRQYESVYVPILRKDSDFARILPKVIVAISNIYGTNSTYLNLTKVYLEKLVSNTTEAEWALRYFAAQTYISMAGVDNKRQNLTAAYDLLVGNVTHLSHEQESLLDKYIKPIDETIPRGTTKEKEKQMKEVIKKLKNVRKKELPPMHEGLLTNYQVLIEIMKELNTPQQEKNRIKAIVDKSFVYKIIRYKFFSELNYSTTINATVSNYSFWFDNIPAVFLLPQILKVDLKITLNNNGIEELFCLDEDIGWKINSVSRGRSDSLENFSANLELSYSNDTGKKIQKEQNYFIYVTFYYNGFKYTIRCNKPAGTGHFLGVFDVKPNIGQIIYD
jgi:hypothetical protein